MAIKDQCEQCRKYTTSCTENSVFDGVSCSQYAKRINLEKSEVNITEDFRENSVIEDSEDDFIDYPDPNDNIHGWLSFFLFSIGLGGLISAIMPIATYNIQEYGGSYILSMTNVVFGIMLLFLAIYTIFSFVKRSPNAVFLAKMYTITVFVSNLLSLISGGEFAESGFGSLAQVVRSLIWGVIWYLYLCFSNQVNEIIPKSYRKVLNRDYYFMGALILVPVLLLGIGIADMQNINQEKEELFISSNNLSFNEYTDGKIIFTKPFGYTCEKQEIDNPHIILYDLELGDEAWIRICSDYDTDMSIRNFNSYWENWKDESLNEYSYQEICNEKRYVNNNPYYIKSVRYNTETPIIWHYVLLFNVQVGKVCLISYFQAEGNISCLDELLNSIRF